MQHTKKIAVIDSGAGGISILSEILHIVLPQPCIYVADHAGFPYGILDEATLLQRLIKIVQYLTERYQTEIIVIACNTASTLALDDLRAYFAGIQFVGVVPAIKPATYISATKHIGILATPATVIRKYTHNLVKEFASNCQVSFWGSTNLVQQAETFINSGILSEERLTEELDNLLKQDREIDTIVLACTHFPLIKSFIQKSAANLCAKHAINHQMHIIDSGEAIARRVASIALEFADKGIGIDDQASLEIESKKNIRITYLSTSKDKQLMHQLADNYDRYINSCHDYKKHGYLIQSQTLHLRLP